MPASPTAPGRATGGCAAVAAVSEPLSRVLAQSETDAERLKAIGCPPERVSVAGNLKFDVRAAAGSRGDAAAEGCWPPVCGSWWRAARWKAKKPRCSKRGRGCSRPIRNWSWSLRRAIRSGSPPWLRCWRNPGIPWVRRSDWRSQAGGLQSPAPAAEARPDRPARHHRRTGLGLLAGGGGLCRRQPGSGRRPQSAGAGAVRRAHRDGPALRQLPRHHRGFAGPKALRIATREELAATLIDLLQDRLKLPKPWASGPGRSLTSRPERRTAASRRSRSCLRRRQRSGLHEPASSARAACCCRWFRSTGWRSLCANCGSAAGWSRCGGCVFRSSASATFQRAARARRRSRLRWPRHSRARGLRVDVLSRGYGRRSKAALRVDPNGAAEEFGDEPLLIAREAGVPVYVAAQRYDAGLLAEACAASCDGPRVASARRGFQHRQLASRCGHSAAGWHDLAGPFAAGRKSARAAQAMRRATVIAIPADDAELERD